MIGTLFSVIIAILLYVFPLPTESVANSTFFAATLFIVSTLFIITQTAITIFAWAPIQKTEQNLTPRLMETFKHDSNLRVTNLFLLIFLFFTYLAVADILFFDQFHKQHILIIWTLLLGIAVDFLHHHLKRVMDFLDPFFIVEKYNQNAEKCVSSAKEGELCGWIDAISETSIKAINRNSMSLALLAIDKLRSITRIYLVVSKGIIYHSEEDAGKFGGSDHVSYILFYLFQRIELIFDKALNEKNEPICSKIVTSLGKVSIYCAKYDITLTSYPLYYLGKFTAKAQFEGVQEVGNRATATLLEVSKVIVKEVDLQYVEIKDTFLSIIDNMHEIAKDTFKNDKTMSIRILTQPFNELRELFQSEKLANHQDSVSIVHNIDVVLNEFNTLETVMSTMPPVPQIVKERKGASEQNKEQEPKKES